MLAKLWDKINAGVRKNIPANTCFLAPRELELAGFLFGNLPGLYRFGGYEDAERKMLVYLPDYLEESALYEDDSPLCCLEASFFEADKLSHRDFLGALMGAGIARETVGDICVEPGRCLFFVTAEITPYVLDNLREAGRTKLHLKQLPLLGLSMPEPEFQEIRDTMASIRLDSVIASGFRIGRSLAADYVNAGKVSIDGLPCEKTDKTVSEGAKISVRGLGKIKLSKSEEGQRRTASRSPFRNMCEESVMNMNEVIARINALAKKAKEGPLTEEEQAERDKLRRIYIDSVKANLVGQLENTYILQPDGTKKKVTKK